MSGCVSGRGPPPPAKDLTAEGSSGLWARPERAVRAVQMLDATGAPIAAVAEDRAAQPLFRDAEIADGLPQRLLDRAREEGRATATVWRTGPDGRRVRIEIFVGA